MPSVCKPLPVSSPYNLRVISLNISSYVASTLEDCAPLLLLAVLAAAAAAAEAGISVAIAATVWPWGLAGAMRL